MEDRSAELRPAGIGLARPSRRRPAWQAVRGWAGGRTLRAQLIAGLVFLLALACAAIGIVTYVVLSHAVLDNLDLQLQAAGGRYAACMEQQHDGVPPPPGASGNCNKTPGLSAGTLGARVKDGEVTEQGVIDGTSRLSAADRAVLAALPPDGRFYTRDLASMDGDYRLTAIRGEDGDVLITGFPLAAMEATLRKVETAETIAFSAVLVLTGLTGTAFVGLSLRPLRRMAATAARVTQLPLASEQVALPERVPGASPRTETGQLADAFNRMLGHVESALARRAASESRLRRFAADASHELRTPLAAIRGYAELALRTGRSDPASVEHALGRVQSEAARMSVLVDDLLLLARLDAGRPLGHEPVDLSRLAIDAASDARAASPGHRWRLDLSDEPFVVRGDEHRLRQVLANLISNAARHTPAGTTVTVALASRADLGAVELSVTDNGPGIPVELQPRLFDRFVRGDSSRSRAAGSTGLGLAIVDAVVTAHHGRVTLASRPGRTRFTITLPRCD